MSIVLSQINIYPVKSTKGISLSRSWVELQGLSLDRRFMIALVDGSMVTARKYPQLLKIKCQLHDHGMILSYPDFEPLILDYARFVQDTIPTHVWKDNFLASSTHELANHWVSQILGEPAQLLHMGTNSVRQGGKFGGQVSFADAFPLLLISEASLADLNTRTNEPHSMDQFRTNIVVSGTEAYAEDTWKNIRIGDVVFEIHSPCSRCILTTLDPETGQPHPMREPLSTLANYRQGKGGIFFGVNLIALNEGIIQQGDLVELLP